MELKIYRMNEMVPMPVYGTKNSACFDLCACIEDRGSIKGFYANNEEVILLRLKNEKGFDVIRIPPRARVLIPTGMIFDMQEGYSIKVYARSGLALKKGLAMVNGVGVIDSDYVEEVFVPMINNSDETLEIKHGDRVAQAEIVLAKQTSFSYIQERPAQKSDRAGGFGSTGVSK